MHGDPGKPIADKEIADGDIAVVDMPGTGRIHADAGAAAIMEAVVAGLVFEDVVLKDAEAEEFGGMSKGGGGM